MKLFKQFIGMPEADVVSGKAKLRALWIFVGIILVSLLITSGARIYNYQHFSEGLSGFLPDSFADQIFMFSVYALLNIGALIYAYCNARKNNNKNSRLLLGATLAGVGVAGLTVLAAFLVTDMLTLSLVSSRFHLGMAAVSELLQNYMNQYGKLYIIPLLPTLLSFAIFGFHRNRKGKTSGIFGNAKFANKSDLKKMGAYDSKGGIFGKDNNGKYLYFPMGNRTLVSQPKGGKTTGGVMPGLLSENRPIFVHDVKGELWGVSARQRYEKFGHEVVTIDPYRVTKGADFIAGKPEALYEKFYTFNPLEFIPEDPTERDRAIAALAYSIVVNGDYDAGSDHPHFRACAEILLQGLIEWILVKEPVKNLVTLHDFFATKKESFKELLQEMLESDLIKAKTAASMIFNIGAEEFGSIYSTTYRQLYWLTDRNLRELVSQTNFDFNKFLRNEMDIFITMPEDQVKPQSRLMRMLLSCLRNKLVQLQPSELPDRYSLFIFDELGQMGYCPNIEEMIEILRARGVVVWSIFQTLSQVMEYKKPDLFLGAEFLQFFRIADKDAIELIQFLGGKKTVSLESKSKSQGGRKNQGNASTSIQEHEAALIHSDDVRKLPIDEQYVFIHGQDPIHCKKLAYFAEPIFEGTFDPNPVERKRT